MLIKVKSAYFSGVEAYNVDVEVSIVDRSMPGFEIVGLPSREIAESRERVKNAVINVFKEFPHNKKIIVNLAPADVPKEGSYYDLPIAAAIISYMRDFRFPEDSAFFGEVSMDGSVRKGRGVYLFTTFAKEERIHNVFIPIGNYNEVRDIKDVKVYPISGIRDLERFNGAASIDLPDLGTGGLLADSVHSPDTGTVDFGDVIGQDVAKRALLISASGGHSVLMMGSPGSGKTMLAKALCGILPKLLPQEEVEVAKIYSACGLFDNRIFSKKFRPYRCPHHTISYSGMVGGGSIPRPGEISLAHKGILFLDEFSEFQLPIIESLRQPMEEGFITISRSRGSVKFPCDFTLIACSNPCPCGFLGDRRIACTCKPPQIERYRKKLSGPILDRLDLFVRVWSPSLGQLAGSGAYMRTSNKVSQELVQVVEFSRSVQENRFKYDGITVNARMSNDLVKKYCILDSACEALLTSAIDKFNLSPRSVFKIIKAARTIADMEAAERITSAHLAESIQYKCL